jgi:hypothetical protein
MNRNVLTMLGCSGSLVLILATSTVAQTDSLSAPSGNSMASLPMTIAQGVDSIASSSANFLAVGNDTVGDFAQSKFGCDCSSCRNLALQMILKGGNI